MGSGLRFGVLGALDVSVDGRSLAVPRGKPRVVLALLLLEANRIVASDRLIDALWRGDPPASAANALQVHVSQLRKALDFPREAVVTVPPGYAIELRPGELDLEQFERLAAEGDEALAGGDFEVAATTLRAALALWRGGALEDLTYESCLQGAIHRLEELRLAVVEHRIDAELALGRHSAVAAELEHLVGDHPLREGLVAQLMLALYRSGRQAEALAAYQAGRERLLGQFGLEPSPGLRRLERAILVQDEALELPRRDAASSERGIIVLAEESGRLPALLMLGRALVSAPARELVLARPVAADTELGAAADRLHGLRAELLDAGVAARAATFVSADPASDVARLVQRLPADLLVLAAPQSMLATGVASGALGDLAAAVPCDLAILCGGDVSSYESVVVPFGGGTHEWAAVELGAWLARARGAPLRLAGAAARRGRRDASRLLADVSLAVQRSLGVAAEPMLVEVGASALLDGLSGSSLLVVGLPERWQDALGETRLELAKNTRTPVLLVRAGLRPSGLAPQDSLTRYTWSLATA